MGPSRGPGLPRLPGRALSLEHHGCLEGLDPRQLADAIGAALSGTLPAARTTDEGTGPDLRLDSGA